MAEPVWFSYVGAITGVVGTVTGVAGAIMGYVAYRRSNQLKALDLRLELRKCEQDLRYIVLGMSEHLEHAKSSRIAVAAAQGVLVSSGMQRWKAEWEEAAAAAKAMAASLPEASEAYASCSHRELEDKLVATHAALHNARRLQAKYDASLAADGKDRDNIRADLRATTQAKLQGKS